jgi:hypothetical protein
MARPEVTGKNPRVTPSKPRRAAGPPIDEPRAIEPTDPADAGGEATLSAQHATDPPANRSEAIEPTNSADANDEKKKRKRQPRPFDPSWPGFAFSVEEFCRAHGISIGFFYELQKKGLAPKIMKLGIRTLISAEEAARWRAERTAASNNAA